MNSHEIALVENIWIILLVTGVCIWHVSGAAFSPIQGLSGTITQGPSNTVAEIGKQVKLNCTAIEVIGYWFLSKNGVANDEVIITGPGCSSLNPVFADHYAVETLGGGTTCNLIVSNITMEQAGVYKCIDGTTQVLSILTVSDSSPVITVNSTTVVENESVLIECVLNHNGSVAPAPTLRPYLYWTDFNGQNVSSSYNSTTENTAVSQITVLAGLQDITPYTCHVYLQLIPPTTPNYANNIPSVSSSATSPTILASQTSATTSMVSSSSTATITTTNDAFRCEPVTTTSCKSSDSCDGATAAAIAVGVILFVSLAMNIIQLIFLIRNQRHNHDPYQRTGTILQPEILDRSNGTPAPATYEELTRPTEFDLLPITYEQLKPKPPIYMNRLS